MAAAAAATPSVVKMTTLNELNHDWTKYNFPAGKSAGKAVETKDQMTARHALMDAWVNKELPSVLFLQEISLLRRDTMAASLIDKFHIFIANNLDVKGGTDVTGGCAVLLRRDQAFDFKGARGYPFTFKTQKPDDNKRRVALVVVVKLNGKELALVSVHLEGKPDSVGDQMRVAQVCEAVEFARLKSPKGTIVVAGDFNQPLESIEAIDKALGSKGMYRVANSVPTFQEKEHVLDYMYVSSQSLATNAATGVFPSGRTKSMSKPPFEWAGWGSDHSAFSVIFSDL